MLRRTYTYNFKLTLWVLAVLLPIGLSANTDTTKHTPYFNASISAGKVIPHHTILNPLQKGTTVGVELQYYKNGTSFDNLFKFFGASLNAYRYGNQNLGYSLSLTPIAIAPLVMSGKTDIYLLLGAGVGFATERYNPVSNPTNYSISTPVNISGQLGLVGHFKIKSGHTLFAKITAHHLSNGNTKKPNYGVNTLTIGAGVQLGSPTKYSPADKSKAASSTNQRFGIALSIGYREAGDYGGKKYVTGSLKPSYTVFNWDNNSLWVGADIMFDKASLFHLERDGINHSGNADAFKIGVSIGAEKMLNKVILMASCGVYAIRKDTTGGVLYQHIGVGYQLTPYLGAQLLLKTHWTTADYLEFGFRIRI